MQEYRPAASTPRRSAGPLEPRLPARVAVGPRGQLNSRKPGAGSAGSTTASHALAAHWPGVESSIDFSLIRTGAAVDSSVGLTVECFEAVSSPAAEERVASRRVGDHIAPAAAADEVVSGVSREEVALRAASNVVVSRGTLHLDPEGKVPVDPDPIVAMAGENHDGGIDGATATHRVAAEPPTALTIASKHHAAARVAEDQLVR
jgi:hypothetical protein